MADTKNCWRTTPSLVCEPMVTMVLAAGHDAVDGLEDAALLLAGIHADGQRRRALVRCGVCLLAGGQRAELRAVAGQQGEGQDSHRDEDDDRDDDGGRSASKRRVPGSGAPGPGQLGFQQHGADLGRAGSRARVRRGRAGAGRLGRTGPQRGCGAGSRPPRGRGQFRSGGSAAARAPVAAQRRPARRAASAGRVGAGRAARAAGRGPAWRDGPGAAAAASGAPG